MKKHATHFDDCGCQSERLEHRIAMLEMALYDAISCIALQISDEPPEERCMTVKRDLARLNAVLNDTEE